MSDDKKQITLYFCIISPYTYIGYAEFLSLCSRHDLSVNLKPLNLRELFGRTGGVLPNNRHISRQRYRKLELLRLSKSRNIPINLQPRHFPYDYTIADRMIISAILLKKPFSAISSFILKGLEACWKDEKNMADKSVLLDIASSSGLDGLTLYNNIDKSETVSQYSENLNEAVEKSIFGAPFFEYRGELFWGQDRLEHLEDMIVTSRLPIKLPS